MRRPLDPRFPGSALVVAHPGHELRVHGWLERERPVVFVLTDGSGSAGVGRLEATRRVLRATGARESAIFGRLTDRALYARLLSRDPGWAVELADELAGRLHENAVGVVAGDALEGFNPGHDVARLLVNAAVTLVSVGRPAPSNLEFPLEAHPRALAGAPDDVVEMELDAAAAERKFRAAAEYGELAHEVEHAVERYGAEAFARERLTPSVSGLHAAPPGGEAPFYERYGASRVAAGAYREAIRLADHVAPVADALRRHCQSRGIPCAS